MAEIFLGVKEDEGKYEITDEKTGEVKSGDYHNYMIYYATEDMKTSDRTKGYEGYEALTAKVKAQDINKVFGFNVTRSSFKDMIMKNCQILYDRNGNVKNVIFEKEVTANG